MGIDDKSSHPELCLEVAGGVTRTIVCLFREPDAGNPPVRFDEREEETGLSQTGLRRRGENPVNCHREATVTAPLLDSTQNPALRLKAFYKKECQEKTSPSTGGREDLSRDPAHCTVRVPHDFAGGFAFELSSIP